MNPGLVVRPMEAGETDEAAAVWWRARTTAEIPAPVHSREQVGEWFRDVLLPDEQCWVADQDGALVAVLTLDGDDLDQLYVVPEAAGQGIGSLLVELAKQLRPDGLALWTFQRNLPAQEFYRRHGFTEVRRTDGAANEEHAPDVRMVWGTHPEAVRTS